MPKLMPQGAAYDRIRKQAYLLASHGKVRYLLAADPNMKLRVVRKVATSGEQFSIASDRDNQPCAVFWGIDKTTVVPLADPDARAKTITVEGGGMFTTEIAFVPEPDGLFGV